MKLKLQIISHKDQPSSSPSTVEIGEAGGVIGRSGGCDLVLPDTDRVISGKHALITIENGQVRLTDTSLNGTCINNTANAIGRDQHMVLQSGDRILIGDYVISADIVDESASLNADKTTLSAQTIDDAINPFTDAAPENNPFAIPEEHSVPDQPANLDPLTAGFGSEPPPATSQPFPEPQPGNEPSIDDILFGAVESDPSGLSAPAEQPKYIPASEPDNVATINEFLQPPVAQTEEPKAQDEVDPLASFFDSPPADKTPTDTEDDQLSSQPANSVLIPEGWNLLDDSVQQDEPLIPEPAALSPVTPDQPEADASAPLINEAPPAQTELEPSPIPDVEKPAIPKPVAAEEPQQVSHPHQPEAASTTPAGNHSTAMQAFLEGAGVAGLQLSQEEEAEFFRSMGELFRINTSGLLDVLRARTDIKSTFRISMTMIQPTENNPLKFSLNTDDALHKILQNPGNACLPAEQAFSEAFDDIKAHELAVMAGMQAALTNVLTRFQPDQLESFFENRGGKGLLQQKKSWYWDQYKTQHKEILSTAEDQFHELFGDTFTVAYEKQIQKLKDSRKRES